MNQGSMNRPTREALLGSYSAAAERANLTGAFVGTAESVAGQYLTLASGISSRAMMLLPSVEGPFWARVVSHLAAVAAEERDLGTPERSTNDEDFEPNEPINAG